MNIHVCSAQRHRQSQTPNISEHRFKAVVLKLFQEEAPLRRVNSFVPPPKRKLMTKTSSNLQFYLQILDCTKNKLIYKLTMLEQQFCL